MTATRQNDHVQAKTKKDEGATPEAAPSGRSVQLRKQLAGMSFAEGEQALAPPPETGDVQAHGGGGQGDVHRAAAHGISGGGGAMPHGSKIQDSFGSHDISGISAHVGGKAAEGASAMGAEAYATGNNIAFGKSPSLHTAAHEAAHVIQQQAGVSLSGGVGKAGDSYEQHADQVADAVVAGKSAAPILDKMSGGGGGGGVQSKAIQRKVDHTKDGQPVTIPDYAASGKEDECAQECIDNIGTAATEIDWVKKKIADNGGAPSNSIQKFIFKWGSTHHNNDGDLPGTVGGGGYKEYYVRSDGGGISGSRRVVQGRGKTYYTNTHYGNHGDPAFYHVS